MLFLKKDVIYRRAEKRLEELSSIVNQGLEVQVPDGDGLKFMMDLTGSSN